jgi:hypothetical protein
MMTNAQRIERLNCLLRVLCRSVAQYARGASPWTPPERQAVAEAIADLANDQDYYAGKVAAAVQQRGGRPEPDTFPMDFTAINDLSIDYLLRTVLEGHRRDTAELERCAAALSDDPALGELAEEIVGNARGHGEILARLQRPTPNAA